MTIMPTIMALNGNYVNTKMLMPQIEVPLMRIITLPLCNTHIDDRRVIAAIAKALKLQILMTMAEKSVRQRPTIAVIWKVHR